MVIVGMALFQWQYQNLHPAMGFSPLSLWCKFKSWWPLPCGAVGQSWTSSCEFQRSYAVSCKSTDPTSFGHALMVISPTQPGGCCQSFSVEPLSRDCLCWAWQEAHALFWYFFHGKFIWSLCLCLCKGCSPWKVCPYWSWPHPPWMSLSQMRPHHQYSSNLLLQYHHQDQWWPWLDWKGGWQVLALIAGQSWVTASGTILGMSSSLSYADLCSHLTLTCWESIEVLLFTMITANRAARESGPTFLCGDGKELSK